MEAVIFDGATLDVKYHSNWPIPKIVTPFDVKIKGEFPATKDRKIPMGHELCGVIVEIGSKVHSSLKVGRKVVVDPNRGCMNCDFCRSGHYNYCSGSGKTSTVGINIDGAWAEYLIVPDFVVYALPDEITLEQGGLCEPYSCVVHGWNRAAPIALGSKILVMGAGIIGNLWVTMLHMHGHRDVTISEMNRVRLDLTKKLDTGYRLSSPDVLGKEKTLYDVVIDCTGSARAMEGSFNLVNYGGKYVLFGCCPQPDTARINPFDIYNKEMTVIGIKMNPYTFVKAIAVVQDMGDRYLNYERLGVRLYKLSEYEKALNDLKAGTVAKAMFKI